MVREARREDLDSLLKLYLFLHEERIPDHDRHLTETWEQILGDRDITAVIRRLSSIG